jgi:mono/diheme cytochrome c family protein
MIQNIYDLLRQMGFSHPLHAPMTHLPLGMVMGAFLFALVARFRRKPSLVATARHCTVLALLSLPPTVILGIADWQYFYGGAWLFPIRMKILLASMLAVLLLICLLLERRSDVMRRTLLLFLTFGVLVAAGLGYFGGELVFARQKTAEPAASGQERKGADQFAKTCASCHPRGETPFKPNLAPRSAPQLENFESFVTYLRHPKARDGSNTIMPPFPAERLSDEEAKAIYQYLLTELKTSG